MLKVIFLSNHIVFFYVLLLQSVQHFGLLQMCHGYENLTMKNKWKMAGKVWKIPILEPSFVYLHEDIGKWEEIYTTERKKNSKTFWKK